MVLGTALFKGSPFKNVVATGMVLAEDGRKMSKLLKNYPDPMNLLDELGADALRLYLLNSPVVEGEPLKFSKDGVEEQLKKNFVRLNNVLSFFTSYANVDGYEAKLNTNSCNKLDKWLLSRFNTLVSKVREDMSHYRLKFVVSYLSDFVEDLTNTYVRLNRYRFQAGGYDEDKENAFNTLYYVLLNFSKVLAPFAPFYAEEMYNTLEGKELSVHLEEYPVVEENLVLSALEMAVDNFKELLVLGRNYRDKTNLKVKVPLLKATVYAKTEDELHGLKLFEKELCRELNVKELCYSQELYSVVKEELCPNFKTLGKLMKSDFGDFKKELSKNPSKYLQEFLNNGVVNYKGYSLTEKELFLKKELLNKEDHFLLSTSLCMEMDPYVGEEQLFEGKVKEFLREVQKKRKELNLELDDRVRLFLSSKTNFETKFMDFKEEFMRETLCVSLTFMREEDLKGKVDSFEDLFYVLKKE